MKISEKIFLLVVILGVTDVSQSQSITWKKLYGYPNSDEGAYDICESGDGNFFVVGSFGNNFSNSRIYVLKLNLYGDTIWTKKYQAGHYAYAVAPSKNCGCVMTGYGLDFLFIMKIDCNGNIIWQKFYSKGAVCFDVQRVSDGGVTKMHGSLRGQRIPDGH